MSKQSKLRRQEKRNSAVKPETSVAVKPNQIMNAQNFEDVKVSDEEYSQIKNSLGGLLSGLGIGTIVGGSQLSQVDTLFKNNRWYLISNMRQILSELYVEHGIIQTLVDQPIDDAFRKGVIFNSDQLSEDEIEDLKNYIKKNNVLQIIGQAMKWTRLYGGGGLIVVTEQDPMSPLSPLKQKDSLSFKSADMWELFYSSENPIGGYDDISPFHEDSEHNFNFYGIRINASRVLIARGKEAPSFIKPRLRGWGMSVVERVVRALNSYLKNNDVVFELLDEAKVDVFKMKGFNSALATKAGTARIEKSVQETNQLKNFHKAIVMDLEDEYEQKQMSFSGLGEMLDQIRQEIASALKMPISKIFGVSSTGFNSGEDDIEVYNAMLESEVRTPAEPIILSAVRLVCEHLFGYAPDDLTIEFHPLRVLSAEQEENVKNLKYNRYSGLLAQGLFTDKEFAEQCKKEELYSVATEVEAGVRDMEPPEPPAVFDTPTNIVPTQKEVTTKK